MTMTTDFGGVEIPFVTHLGFRLDALRGRANSHCTMRRPEH
jgi:hypothetical protein